MQLRAAGGREESVVEDGFGQERQQRGECGAGHHRDGDEQELPAIRLQQRPHPPKDGRSVAGQILRGQMVGADSGRAHGLMLRRGSERPNRRKRREFVTTKTELNAIVRPAIIGLSRPKAASGMAATLYAKAQKRFPLIVRRVARESRTATTAVARSPWTSVRSEAAMATSVPVPIAMPRSAPASAAASLTPSPTMATTRPSARNSWMTRSLSAGVTSAMTRSM